MDNLPNQNNNSNPWDNPKTSAPEIPNPPDNNTVDPVQSWVAQHEQRDASGRFAPTEHLKNPNQNPNPAPAYAGLSSPIQVTQDNKYSEKNDPPLVDVKVTNPVTYLKKWLARLLKNEGIDIHIKIKPLTVITLGIVLATTFGVGVNVGRIFFPNSSPILHRSITLQGSIQKSDSGQYYLSLPDNSMWTLRPTNNNINLSDDINKQVMVKGNLTAEQNVIEVKEVLVFEKPTPVIYAPTQTPATNSAQPNQ